MLLECQDWGERLTRFGMAGDICFRCFEKETTIPLLNECEYSKML
jgi:hypothetical protein